MTLYSETARGKMQDMLQLACPGNNFLNKNSK